MINSSCWICFTNINLYSLGEDYSRKDGEDVSHTSRSCYAFEQLYEVTGIWKDLYMEKLTKENLGKILFHGPSSDAWTS